ncbi:hypothetical protein [Micromonospora sp. NPDC049171]|uniref:hypothetical protein n=1 Tax=Micromonospora sp. NPDC049171 TaxID=3155770 RepID=UPI0033DD9E9C
MAASRDLTLAGYEVYRFGTNELHDEDQARPPSHGLLQQPLPQAPHRATEADETEADQLLTSCLAAFRSRIEYGSGASTGLRVAT